MKKTGVRTKTKLLKQASSQKFSAKHRNQGLDGLRGIAALAVALSHSALFFHSHSDWGVHPEKSLLEMIWYSVSGGGVGVQYLFVLCGFLMGYLYWDKKISIWAFIKKRYLRIFPLYTAVVTYDMLLYKNLIPHNVQYQPILYLFLLLVVWHVVWTQVYLKQKTNLLANVTLAIFLLLQGVSAMVNTVLSYVAFKDFHFTFASTWTEDVVVYTSNIFLTTPFLRVANRLQGVFWSLAPEVLFYLVYVAVLWPYARQVLVGWRRILVTAVLLLVLLYAMEKPMWTTLDFRSLNILRWVSFIGGMYLGWSLHNEMLRSIAQRVARFPLTTPIVLASVPLTLLSDHYFWTQHSPEFFALYYGTITCVVLLAIAQAVLAPESLTSKVLSHRVLVLIGTCSYSLYLIHEHVLSAISNVYKPGNEWENLLYVGIIVPVLIAVSYVSYVLVERPYFTAHKK